MSTKQVFFKLNLSKEQCLEYYSGKAINVLTYTENGIRVAFPAAKLLPYIMHNGVQGDFCLTYTKDNKFVSLKPAK